jgi:hypothetical protein
MPRIHERFAAAQDQLHGWWHPDLCRVLVAIDGLQVARGLAGWIVELGVLRGRSLAALALLASERDWVLGIDRFDSPGDNTSGSGELPSLADARRAINLVGVAPDRVSLVSQNLGDLDAYRLERLMEGLPGGKQPIRLAHIDAGHAFHETTNDLETIVPHLDDLGAILLDDAYNHHWPEVGLAFAQFLRTHAGWDAVGCFYNRVLLVRQEASPLYRAALEPLYGRPWQSFFGKPYFAVP